MKIRARKQRACSCELADRPTAVPEARPLYVASSSARPRRTRSRPVRAPSLFPASIRQCPSRPRAASSRAADSDACSASSVGPAPQAVTLVSVGQGAMCALNLYRIVMVRRSSPSAWFRCASGLHVIAPASRSARALLASRASLMCTGFSSGCLRRAADNPLRTEYARKHSP